MKQALSNDLNWIQQFPEINPPHNSQPFPNHSSERPLNCLYMIVIGAHVLTDFDKLLVTIHQKEI